MKKLSVSSKVHALLYVCAALVLFLSAYQVYGRYSEQKAVSDELHQLEARHVKLVEEYDQLGDEIIKYEQDYAQFLQARQAEHDELVAKQEQANQDYLNSLPTLYSAATSGEAVRQLFVSLQDGSLDTESQRNVVYQLQRRFSAKDNMAMLVSYTYDGTWAFHDVASSFSPYTVCWTQRTSDDQLAVVYFAEYDSQTEIFSNKRRVLMNYEGFLEMLVADIEPAP